MSVRNGDKARFGRLRKQKILLRKRIREMREAMENQNTDNNRRVRAKRHNPADARSYGLMRSGRLRFDGCNEPCNRKVSSPLKEDSHERHA